MFDLTGRVAVVTGASAGLGRGEALALARQGADVAILARREDKLNEVAEEIRSFGRKCLPVVCDVTVEEQLMNAVKQIIETFGKVDILVNNAG
ncbi:MAG: SDR family NAD(P)-dependent oxidoreductase, partial [Oscillospiraceae bacterium]|nr:SDR family NAD(P)-dependent oxidoreductase [Oscillospiraceae bacterium]